MCRGWCYILCGVYMYRYVVYRRVGVAKQEFRHEQSTVINYRMILRQP